MFTGLIETTGTVASLTPGKGATRIVIHAPTLASRWRIGDSIAVNGTCLTALDSGNPTSFAADLAAETLDRTTLGSLAVGTTVNLELPTPAGSPLGGHVVQGHVDATANFISLIPLHEELAVTDWRLTVELPAQLAMQVIAQGSITLDGISLTVARRLKEYPAGLQIEIAVIPHTYASTNLHTLQPGTRMNVETDVLAKYAAAQHHTADPEWLTASYLIANGY